MKKLEDVNIYIVAVNWVLGLLLFLSIFVFAFQVKDGNGSGAVSSLQAIIPIAAAWLVLCIADRQLLADRASKQAEQKLECVKSLHYLIIIATDLNAKVGHFVFMLRMEDYNVLSHQLESLAIGIEKRYEQMLHEKDAYKFMPGEILSKMLGLSGGIYGLTTVLRSIALEANARGKPVRDIFLGMDKDRIVHSIESNSSEINLIVKDFYRIRASIGD